MNKKVTGNKSGKQIWKPLNCQKKVTLSWYLLKSKELVVGKVHAKYQLIISCYYW